MEIANHSECLREGCGDSIVMLYGQDRLIKIYPGLTMEQIQEYHRFQTLLSRLDLQIKTPRSLRLLGYPVNKVDLQILPLDEEQVYKGSLYEGGICDGSECVITNPKYVKGPELAVFPDNSFLTYQWICRRIERQLEQQTGLKNIFDKQLNAFNIKVLNPETCNPIFLITDIASKIPKFLSKLAYLKASMNGIKQHQTRQELVRAIG